MLIRSIFTVFKAAWDNFQTKLRIYVKGNSLENRDSVFQVIHSTKRNYKTQQVLLFRLKCLKFLKSSKMLRVNAPLCSPSAVCEQLPK